MPEGLPAEEGPVPEPSPPGTGPLPDPAAPSRTGGDWRDLVVLVVFLALLALLSTGAYASLQEWKARVDALPVVRHEQPCWSDLVGTLAYLRSEQDPTPGHPARKVQLWSVSRFGDSHRLLADLPSEPVRLVGWLGGEQRVILQVLESPGRPAALLDIGADGRGGRRLRFPEGMRLVGTSRDEVFFERPHQPRGTEAGGLELLAWNPEAKPGSEFRPLLTLPGQEGEPVSIESLSASPDGRRLALVLRAPSVGGPLGLWIYHREPRTLVWTTVSVEDARAMRVDWSPDSTSLVGAAWRDDASELYLVQDRPGAIPVRLRAASAALRFTPVWPRDGNRVLLLAGSRVLEYDFRLRRADLVLGPSTLGLVPEELVLSPLGSLAAFHGREGEEDDLFVTALRGGRPDGVSRPGARQAARNTLRYEIATGLEYAVSVWLGSLAPPTAGTSTGSEKPPG